ncbi:hypothetical protein OBBRIDRAFT_797079 [Obba rivulosa]|uniref:Uncharacterized protein n=1 Tax=Obba rivulosa TaxID=1052685 RepID=A0A8E2AW95_9APHY|nr:hypothetical protein OBBRIDRAFT_797079 [Obba rivulosa]
MLEPGCIRKGRMLEDQRLALLSSRFIWARRRIGQEHATRAANPSIHPCWDAFSRQALFFGTDPSALVRRRTAVQRCHSHPGSAIRAVYRHDAMSRILCISRHVSVMFTRAFQIAFSSYIRRAVAWTSRHAHCLALPMQSPALCLSRVTETVCLPFQFSPL